MTLVEDLHQRASEFYAPPAKHGTVQVKVRGNPELDHVYDLGTSLHMQLGQVETADAEVTLSAKMVRYILDTATLFEPRSSPYAQTVRVAGDMTLVHHFVQLLKRPEPASAALLADVRRRHVGGETAMQEVDGLDVEAILQAIVDNRPLCARGALNSELIHWSIDDLDRNFGAVALRNNPVTGAMEYFRDIIAAYRSSENNRLYTSGCTVPDQIMSHFAVPGFADKDFQPARIWFGRKREGALVTKLHCDLTVSFLSQIWGEKRLNLYSPDQYTCFAPVEAYNFYQVCQADPGAPDYDRFPQLKNARPIEVSIWPGDLLIIPVGWFHCVWAVDDVFSVSRFMEQATAERLHRSLSVGTMAIEAVA